MVFYAFFRSDIWGHSQFLNLKDRQPPSTPRKKPPPPKGKEKKPKSRQKTPASKPPTRQTVPGTAVRYAMNLLMKVLFLRFS